MKVMKNMNLCFMIMAIMICILFVSQSLFADDWEEVTTTGDKPEARYGHSMIKIDYKAYIASGAGGSGIELNDLWAFNKDNGEWEKKVPENDPPPPRKNHCAFTYDGKLYIGWGDQGGIPVGSAFYKYDPATNTWETLYPSGDDSPEERTEASVTVIGDKAYFQGGRNPATGTVFKDFWALHLKTFAMEKLGELGVYEGPHYGHQSIAVGNDLYILGGNGSPWGYHTGNLVYHTDGGTWEIVDWKPKPGFANFNQVMVRMFVTMFYQQLSIYLFGGRGPKFNPYGDLPKINAPYTAEEDTVFHDMWRCNTQDSSVTRCADLPVALTNAAGVLLDDEFYLFGGMKSDSSLSDALYRYKIEDTQIETMDQTPNVFCLYPNYPNPFNPKTTIQYAIPKAGRVSLRVFDLQGKQVKLLVNQYQSPGNHSISFNGSELPSGVYFYKLEIGRHTQIRKMLLIK